LIAAGDLDRQIEILKRRVVKSDAGEESETFVSGLTAWAKVVQQAGRDYFAARQVHAEETMQFTIRYRTDFDQFDRIGYRGRQFRIAHMAELGRREAWEITGVVAQN
jgi:SPP1 family predicted phage head-tail adaptor